MKFFINKSTKKIILTFSSRGFSAGGTLLLTISLGYLLKASGTGLFMIGFSTMMGLKAIGCLGMENAILRFGGESWGRKLFDLLSQYFTCSIFISIVICLPVSIIFFAAAPYIAHTFFSHEEIGILFKIVAIAYPFLVITSVMCAWMRACELPEISSFFEIGSISLILSAVLWINYFSGCVFFEINPTSAMLVLLTIVVIEAFVGILFVRLFFNISLSSWINKKYCKKFTSSLVDYFCIDFIFYITQWGAVIFLGVFSSSTDVGIFTVAHRLAFTVNFIINVLESVVAPKFSHLYSIDDNYNFKKLALNTTKYMFILSLPVMMIMLFFPSYILGFWGKDFLAGKYILMILAFSQFINIITGPVAFILCMTGYQKKLRNVLVVSASAGIMGYVVIVPALGGIGAALSVLITVVIQNVVPVFLVKKYFGLNTLLWWKRYKRD